MNDIETDTRDAFNDAVAAALRMARARTEITISDLAEQSGVAERSLSRFLKGQRDIKASLLFRLAPALGTTPEAILTRARQIVEEPSRPSTASRPIVAASVDPFNPTGSEEFRRSRQ